MKVTKFARIALLKNQKIRLLPSPNDIKLLSEYLVTTLRSMDLSTVDAETFRNVAIHVQARLMTYNKRRPGEVEMMT